MGSRQAPAVLSLLSLPGKTINLFYMRLGVLQVRSGWVRKILAPLPELEPLNYQPVLLYSLRYPGPFLPCIKINKVVTQIRVLFEMFQHFTKLEISLPCSQELATGLQPEALNYVKEPVQFREPFLTPLKVCQYIPYPTDSNKHKFTDPHKDTLKVIHNWYYPTTELYN